LRLDFVALQIQRGAGSEPQLRFHLSSDGFRPTLRALDPCCGRAPQEASSFRVADFDLDGVDDIVVAWSATVNGRDEVTLQLYKQLATGWARDKSFAFGLAAPEPGRHPRLTVADLNNDGYPDLIMAANGGRVALLENAGGPHRALRVLLQGRPGNHAHGSGSTLELAMTAQCEAVEPGAAPCGVRRQLKAIGVLATSPDGRNGQDPRVYFGLGAGQPLALVVKWASGRVSRLEQEDLQPSVDTGEVLVIVEPDAVGTEGAAGTDDAAGDVAECTCGLPCVDMKADCAQTASKCGTASFAQKCARTCGRCPDQAGAPVPAPAPCHDMLATCDTKLAKCKKGGTRNKCKRTCGSCSGPCEDDGTYNCARKAQKCDKAWVKKRCSRTCGFCGPPDDEDNDAEQCVDDETRSCTAEKCGKAWVKTACPRTCGLCDAEQCVDDETRSCTAKKCGKAWVKTACPRTCGLCSRLRRSLTTGDPAPACADDLGGETCASKLAKCHTEHVQQKCKLTCGQCRPLDLHV
jgi:hypothetical protein